MPILPLGLISVSRNVRARLECLERVDARVNLRMTKSGAFLYQDVERGIFIIAIEFLMYG